jgi:hypothetical protein
MWERERRGHRIRTARPFGPERPQLLGGNIISNETGTVNRVSLGEKTHASLVSGGLLRGHPNPILQGDKRECGHSLGRTELENRLTFVGLDIELRGGCSTTILAFKSLQGGKALEAAMEILEGNGFYWSALFTKQRSGAGVTVGLALTGFI